MDTRYPKENMPYRKEQFINGEYYHIINRGLDDRDIFLDEMDYKRFLEGIEKFNTPQAVCIQASRKLVGHPVSKFGNRVSNPPLVEIICYCLLPNHFHLLLKQIQTGGIQKFLQKLSLGYTKYFNLKNERRGHLFQNVFKAVPILEEPHFLHVSRYIHLNALDLFEPKWREGKVLNWEKCKEFLEKYRWSNYLEFIKGDFLKENFKTSEDYKNFLREWAEGKSENLKSFSE